ncbi:MAG: hypothetical protein FWF08_02240 [Oscillospiraceae bacterium]|nr:hypothetical protein [Oscillospiraceae bacterium]
MLDKKYIRNVPLPEGLTYGAIFDALKNTQDFFTMIRTSAKIVLSSIIQTNNFSGAVSNVFTKKIDEISPYKSFHDQRYPDLKNPNNNIGLEVKASNKPMKGGEGHNGHSGWHIIICYELLENGDIEFTQAELANLIGYEKGELSDWKYQGSQRNINNSQRTETYITTRIGTAKLRDGTVYLNDDKVEISNRLQSSRESLINIHPIPKYSPFSK